MSCSEHGDSMSQPYHAALCAGEESLPAGLYYNGGKCYGWHGTLRVVLAGSEELKAVKLCAWDKYKNATEASLARDVSLLKLYNGVVPQRRMNGVMHKLNCLDSLEQADLMLQRGHVRLPKRVQALLDLVVKVHDHVLVLSSLELSAVSASPLKAIKRGRRRVEVVGGRARSAGGGAADRAPGDLHMKREDGLGISPPFVRVNGVAMASGTGVAGGRQGAAGVAHLAGGGVPLRRGGLGACGGSGVGGVGSAGGGSHAGRAGVGVGAGPQMGDAPQQLGHVDAQVVYLARFGMHVTKQEVIALNARGRCGVADLRLLLDDQVEHARDLLDAIQAKSRRGSWHCLIGPAGSGKSCVLRLVSEVLRLRRKQHILTAYTNSATAQVGGKKSFEASIGTAFIRNVLELPENVPLCPKRVLAYLQRHKPYIVKRLRDENCALLVDEC